MANEKIRIKDIAERAGVSVGTVDRVLHKRPNVSPKALEKVNKALEEMRAEPVAEEEDEIEIPESCMYRRLREGASREAGWLAEEFLR